MPKGFSALEKNILKSKGLTDAQLKKLTSAGVACRADFETVGDAGTLCELVRGLDAEVAEKVMAWATGRSGASTASTGGTGKLVVEGADVVYCLHCKTRQPKDYQSGDLCVACGKQAEPILACFWCSSSGPGKFCRQCGAAFIPTAELELGMLLRREGLPKDEIPKRLAAMSAADKEALWGRVRKSRR